VNGTVVVLVKAKRGRVGASRLLPCDEDHPGAFNRNYSRIERLPALQG